MRIRRRGRLAGASADPGRRTDPGPTGRDTERRSGRGFVFDPPTDTEWRAWWTTPRPARLYVAMVVVAAVVTTVAGTLSHGTSGAPGTLLVLVLAGMANVELGRLAEGGRVEQQRMHKGMSAWVFAAALLLGPGLAGWVAATSYAHAGLRGIRIRRWKWVVSCGLVTVAGLAASLTFRVLSGGSLPASGSTWTVASVVVSAAVFLMVEAALLVVISRLNTSADEIYLRAQLAGTNFYLVECAVLFSGAVASVLLHYSPGFVLLAGPVYLLMQRGMLHQPLQHEARHDAKTGVLNFEAWRLAAGAALRQQRREGHPVAVLIVDVDHFKAVNDTFGHLVGDEVLSSTADVVGRCVRRTDLVGRFGGDEFCALLAGTTFVEAVAAAERIRAQIGELPFTDHAVRVTASVGVAVIDGEPYVDVPALVAIADQALYQAKTQGRNAVASRKVTSPLPFGTSATAPRLA